MFLERQLSGAWASRFSLQQQLPYVSEFGADQVSAPFSILER